jgi:regulator of protease activity HflC (stomatin/prohibitin superfamily)
MTRFNLTRWVSRWMVSLVVPLAAALCGSGCATMDIPQAHRGQLFVRAGLWTGFRGGIGLSGPALNPGTHYLGLYNELRMIDCSMGTTKIELDTLTRDGVHFGFDVTVRFQPQCSDASVPRLLTTLIPDAPLTVSTQRVYDTFIRPAIGDVSREFVSPYRANELNEKQAEVIQRIRQRLLEVVTARAAEYVIIHDVTISHLHFPQQMDTANLERAVQSVLRDKAIAERERIQAEIETMTQRRKLVETEADNTAARIDRIGAALRRNPEYMQFELQSKLPEIYREAGSRGNLILTAPNPLNLAASPSAGGAPTPRPTPPAVTPRPQ